MEEVEKDVREIAQKQVDAAAAEKARAEQTASVNAEAEKIEEANKAADRLAKAKEGEIAAAKTKETLGGQASAGDGQKEQTDAEYAEQVLANDV